MPLIIKRPLARSDLSEIWNYIADDHETRTDAFVDFIDQKFQALASRPNLGRSRDELEEGLRSFPVGRYVIFYLVITGRCRDRSRTARFTRPERYFRS
jgi:toxin ParE1/3/4